MIKKTVSLKIVLEIAAIIYLALYLSNPEAMLRKYADLNLVNQAFCQEIKCETTISPGMDRRQVRAILGNPKLKRQLADGTEVWIYSTNQKEKSKNTFSVIFDNKGRVIEVLLPEKEQNKNTVSIQIDI